MGNLKDELLKLKKKKTSSLDLTEDKNKKVNADNNSDRDSLKSRKYSSFNKYQLDNKRKFKQDEIAPAIEVFNPEDTTPLKEKTPKHNSKESFRNKRSTKVKNFSVSKKSANNPESTDSNKYKLTDPVRVIRRDSSIKKISSKTTPVNQNILKKETKIEKIEKEVLLKVYFENYPLEVSESLKEKSFEKDEKIKLLTGSSDFQIISDNESDLISDLNIGLDFGTSSIKCVIRDREREKKFPIKFRNCVGIDSYFLPTVLFKSDKSFSLEKDKLSNETVDLNSEKLKITRLSNLKINFLDDLKKSNELSLTSNVLNTIVFLALTFQRIRGQFFQNYGEIYISSKSELIWSACIGFPSNSIGTPIEEKLVKILKISWHLSGYKNEFLNINTSSSIINKFLNQDNFDNVDLEASCFPEHLAQIDGFVQSEKFDPNAINNFLMLDVGAGTVDMSCFSLNKSTSHNELSKLEFNLFGSKVEFNGVRFLHEHRLDWWRKQIIYNYSGSKERVLEQIEESLKNYNCYSKIPDAASEYVKYENSSKKIQFDQTDKEKFPDCIFYKKSIDHPFYRLIHSFIENRKLHFDDIAVTKVIMCGGGSKHTLYTRLKSKLVSRREKVKANWHPSQFINMACPNDLDMDNNIEKEDFDRVSVAYGLSQIDYKYKIKLVKRLLTADSYKSKTSNWRDRFIDPSQM